MTLGDTKIFSSTSSFVLQTHWVQWLEEGPWALCNHIIESSSCSKVCVQSTYIRQEGEAAGTPGCDWKVRHERLSTWLRMAQKAVAAAGAALS